jgi:hypothetical protein
LHVAADGIWTGQQPQTWKQQLKEYPELAQLTLLLRLTTNITHIHMDMFNEGIPAFSTLLIADVKTRPSHDSYRSAFGKLKSICIQSMMLRDDLRVDLRWIFSLTSCLMGLPALHYYSHGGLEFGEPLHLAIPAAFSLPNVSVLHLQDIWIDYDVAAAIISACGPLKTLILSPAGSYDRTDSGVIYPALASKDTLEHLDIFLGYELETSTYRSSHGNSFHSFKRLKELKISEVALLVYPDNYGTDAPPCDWTTYRPSQRVSALLPQSLELLHIDGDAASLSENTGFLWDFIDDL